MPPPAVLSEPAVVFSPLASPQVASPVGNGSTTVGPSQAGNSQAQLPGKVDAALPDSAGVQLSAAVDSLLHQVGFGQGAGSLNPTHTSALRDLAGVVGSLRRRVGVHLLPTCQHQANFGRDIAPRIVLAPALSTRP